jgi:hypothetical protein
MALLLGTEDQVEGMTVCLEKREANLPESRRRPYGKA